MATTTLSRSAGVFQRRRKAEDIFFICMVLVMLGLVLVGFARTYFLAGVFRAHLPSPIIHIHGALFSAWIVLLITQVTLISVGNVEAHRRLGVAGFGLSVLLVIFGVLAATNSLLRNFVPPGAPFDAKTFYAIPLGDMVIFGTLIFFAYRKRFDPAAHKRLILLATAAMMDAPTGRPPFTVITAHPFMDSVLVYAIALMLIGFDLWSLKKVHKVTIWATVFILVAGQLRVPIGSTGWWHGFASWVLTLVR